MGMSTAPQVRGRLSLANQDMQDIESKSSEISPGLNYLRNETAFAAALRRAFKQKSNQFSNISTSLD
jgi:hypothetical protein